MLGLGFISTNLPMFAGLGNRGPNVLATVEGLVSQPLESALKCVRFHFGVAHQVNSIVSTCFCAVSCLVSGEQSTAQASYC